MPSHDLIAVVNAGSATLKFSVFRDEQAVCQGMIDRLGSGMGPCQASIRDRDGATLFAGPIAAAGHEPALAWLWDWLEQSQPWLRPTAVGHRVVHGGDAWAAPARVTPELLRRLEALIPLAPLHQPHNLGPIRYLMRRQPALPQVVCFDTAFHATQAPLERLFGLPRSWFERGVKRYGFHGLSYEYIAARLSEQGDPAAQGRTVVCHLGNGASMCALRAGRSVATTMSFTALDGLPMGTRCGAIDPGVLLYLLEHEKLTAAQLSELLYRQSGLLGLSGISGDMRDLLASREAGAALAVDYFCYRVARELGALAAVLGGLDALVFTGGIGEHAAPVRARIGELAAWLGVRLDDQANAVGRRELHAADSRVRVLVIPTDEERMIARHVRRLLEHEGG